MYIETYIRGTTPKDLISYNDFADERKETLLSMDELRIKSMYARYGIKFPPKGKTFWEAVAEAILAMPNADVSDGKRLEAMLILDELNVRK